MTELHKRLEQNTRNMMIATIKTMIPDITIMVSVATFIICCLSLGMYGIFFNASERSVTTIARQAMPLACYIDIPLIALAAAAIIHNSYRASLRKARILSEMKGHDFRIYHVWKNAYAICGIITRAGQPIKYSTRLYERELQVFERLPKTT